MVIDGQPLTRSFSLCSSKSGTPPAIIKATNHHSQYQQLTIIANRQTYWISRVLQARKQVIRNWHPIAQWLGWGGAPPSETQPVSAQLTTGLGAVGQGPWGHPSKSQTFCPNQPPSPSRTMTKNQSWWFRKPVRIFNYSLTGLVVPYWFFMDDTSTLTVDFHFLRLSVVGDLRQSISNDENNERHQFYNQKKSWLIPLLSAIINHQLSIINQHMNHNWASVLKKYSK